MKRCTSSLRVAPTWAGLCPGSRFSSSYEKIGRMNASRFYSTTEAPSSFTTEQDETTHFGFKTIPAKEKSAKVGEVFHKVANNYDLMNDLMSVYIHRLWKDTFVSRLNPVPGIKVLDVAGGTGDIAFRILDSIKRSPVFFPSGSSRSSVTVCDINSSMLGVGKDRGLQRGYSDTSEPAVFWVEGDAEALPIESNSMDGYTIAFGIRNCTHIDRVLKEAHRVLRRGGRFMCLEFSHLNNDVMQKLYDMYSFEVIPVLGHVVAGDMASYQYLVESIRQFPRQEEFATMIKDAGFKLVSHEDLTLGVAAIHTGWKL